MSTYFVVSIAWDGSVRWLEEHQAFVPAWKRWRQMRGVFELKRERLELWMENWQGEMVPVA